MELQSWDTWDDGGFGTSTSSAVPPTQYIDQTQATAAQQSSRGNHCAAGMQRKISQEDQDSEPEVDYFQDMVPRFKKPTKVGMSICSNDNSIHKEIIPLFFMYFTILKYMADFHGRC